MPVSVNHRFYSISIAGLAWGASRDFETLGQFETCRAPVGPTVSRDLGHRRRPQGLQIPVYVYQTTKARQPLSTSFLKDGQVANPHQKTGVEAAGIEPASRDLSMKASTCVADCLSLIAMRPESTRSADNQPRTCLAVYVLDMTDSESGKRATGRIPRQDPVVAATCS